MTIRSVILLCAVSAAGMAQPADPLSVNSKLAFHAEATYSPLSIAGSAAYAGLLHEVGAPEEWGPGAGAYGKRVASTAGCVTIYGVLAFGLDSTLHQDPRYFRSHSTEFWRRTAHALRGTILTRTDRGGESLSAWRLGGAYGSAFLSNQWYPDRLNTVRLGVLQGSLRLAFDFASNIGSEFWPDFKRKILRQRP